MNSIDVNGASVSRDWRAIKLVWIRTVSATITKLRPTVAKPTVKPSPKSNKSALRNERTQRLATCGVSAVALTLTALS